MNVTIEEYFGKIAAQEKDIKYQEDNIARLRAKIPGMSISYEGERVKSSAEKNPIERLYCQIEKEEAKLTEMNLILDNMLDEVKIDLSKALNNNTYEIILYKKYCMHMSDGKIAKSIGYTWRWTVELRKKAYKIFENWLKTHKNSY